MENERKTLTRRMKELAISHGFSQIGIAQAGKLSEEGRRLDQWLERKYQASMEWMQRTREKRIDPRAVLPSAKSVVSLSLNYYTEAQHSEDPAAGKISRYAWGDDYHEPLSHRIESLLTTLRLEHPDIEARSYVDTGPVMEKAWAARAGLGWIGKHTNLITKEFGSWIFLGEIFLNVELEFDTPIEDFCGTCTACIEHCPTQAIVEPYVLDSQKCISYLTIEHRGSIQVELAAQFDRWIYGCDICQDVCPWNRFQKGTGETAFQPRVENIAPKLTELAAMSQEEFSQRFHKSPIKRTKHQGLLRNVQTALKAR
ncbi:MAG: tRNA epoxyqueuosine(34) reductase QueG [bacterium]